MNTVDCFRFLAFVVVNQRRHQDRVDFVKVRLSRVWSELYLARDHASVCVSLQKYTVEKRSNFGSVMQARCF